MVIVPLSHLPHRLTQISHGEATTILTQGVYRKVTRKIYDFSPEQLANLTAIVWLYRGQQDRFVVLVQNYFGRLNEELAAVPAELAAFDATLAGLQRQLNQLTQSIQGFTTISPEQHHAITDAVAELCEATTAYHADCTSLLKDLGNFQKTYTPLPRTNSDQHTARQAFDPLADGVRGLVKQVDLLYKLATRAGQVAQDLASDEKVAELYERRAANKLIKQLDELRKLAVEQLKLAVYFHRQIHWLQERFPEATMAAVPGLCRVVSRAEIEAADWSLTPGRYVGVAPAEVDDDFDFEQTLKDIHVELADLNREAVELAVRIQENFEGLGV